MSLQNIDDMVKSVANEIKQPHYFETRWGRLNEYMRREENTDQVVGKVIDIDLTKEQDRPVLDYICRDFQTMKNHKIVPCIFPSGETYVSLGMN